MAKPIGLTPRGGTKQVRVCVPKDLWEAYGGRKDFRISLGKLTGAEAKTAAHRIRADKDAEFDAKRRELSRVLVKVSEVPEAMAAAISSGVYALGLTHDDSVRETTEGRALLAGLAEGAKRMSKLRIGPYIAPPPPPVGDPLDGMSEDVAHVLADLNALADTDAAKALARRDLKAVQPFADNVARRMGLSIDWTTDTGRATLRRALEAHRKACGDRVARDQGDAIPTPTGPTSWAGGAQAGGKAHKLREVFDKWRDGGDNPSAATVRKKGFSLGFFEEFTKDAPIESLTPEQGADFSAWLLKKCNKAKTAKDHLDGVKSLLNKATKAGGLGWIPENPWVGHTVRVKTDSPRRPWTPENLVRLFDSPLFTAYSLPPDKYAGGAAAYWVPLLGIYTGARQSELCQLRIQDIQKGTEGLALHITADQGDEGAGVLETTTKTKQSSRRIPVPSALLALGFADYWQGVKDAGESALFPDLPRAADRAAGEAFSIWFRRYRKAQGLGARWMDFHAFRHTASTRLTDAGINKDVADYLTGHTSAERGSAGKYKHMERLREQQEKLTYPELSLSRVFRCK